MTPELFQVHPYLFTSVITLLFTWALMCGYWLK